MDVFIKSFNRPYYLERCLRSIQLFASGNFNVKILDDGTPPVYLEKIQSQFPEVTIYRSDEYQKKVQAISEHVALKQTFNEHTIPSRFWYDAIKAGSDIFVLLEEDCWLVDKLDLDELRSAFDKFPFAIIKFGWNGCDGMVAGVKHVLTEEVEQISPELPLTSSLLLKPFFRNTFKMRSALQKFRIVKPTFVLPYYTLYTVTSAAFSKAYWLYLWENTGSRTLEGIQLERALSWKKTHASLYGKTRHEKLKTSFITAATNRFKTVNFDMITLHHELNEAWGAGALDPMEHFPNDFNIDYLKSFMQKRNTNYSPERWSDWITVFKGIYRDVGCQVD